jgi:leucyl-tRNA synthetase
MFDMGLVGFTEPFRNVLNQGMVIYAGKAMSKTRGNVVEPMPLVERWGADSIRVTMLFAGPFEEDVDWMHVSPEGVHGWLRRVWRAVHEAVVGSGGDSKELRHSTHRAIRGVSDDIERFRFNTAIAKLMQLTNEIRHALDRGEPAKDACTALVQLLAPFAPFIAEELWRGVLGHDDSVHMSAWPLFDPELARDERVTLVVQVDGKVRDKIEVPFDASEEQCKEAALASPKVDRALDGREVVRFVIVPPKIVNLVTS